MGIPAPFVRLLMDEGRQRPFTGSLLQLGRSTVYVTWEELQRLARKDRFPLRTGHEVELSHDPELARQGCVSDGTLFRALGFDSVESLDISDQERPTYRHDLNDPVPDRLLGRYDVVFDMGTQVAVFDQATAFRNAAGLVRTGGRAVYLVPASNQLLAGLYQYSPVLLAGFFRSNGWRIEDLRICRFEPLWVGGRFRPPMWKTYSWGPDLGGWSPFEGVDGLPVSLWVVATKLEGATADRRPIYLVDSRLEEAGEAVSGTAGASAGPAAGSSEPRGWIYRFAKRLWRSLKRRLAPLRLPVKRAYLGLAALTAEAVGSTLLAS